MPGAAFVAILLSCAVLWSRTLPLSPGWALMMVVLAAGSAAALARVRRHAWQRVLILMLFAGLPVVSVIYTVSRQLTDRLDDTAIVDDQLVSGSICDFPRQQPGSWRFLLLTDQPAVAESPRVATRIKVPARILVNWYAGSDRPQSIPEPGQRWQLKLRMRPPRGLGNSGGFDYERWLFSQHIGATAWVRPSTDNLPVAGAAVCRIAGWRAELARRISRAVGDRPAAAYVLGLSIGAYQALPEEEWDKLRRTGTIHLISISGFHIALLAAPAALFGLFLGGTLLALGFRCRPRVIAAATAFVAAMLYEVSGRV
ncbi:MAG: ComEC/Rec2 family competence protein [Gammaproteobacteria bacterium]